jgi:hypothetical protein
MSDRYGFTTTVQDNYLPRVLDEAAEGTNFILLTDTNTINDSANLVLFASTTVVDGIGEALPNETLTGRPLGDFILGKLSGEVLVTEDGKYYILACFSLDRDEAVREAEATRHEIKRLNNLLEGRVVRVTVESF